MTSVTFVGTGTLARLPEVLARPGTHVRAIGNSRNALARSRFVDEFTLLDYDGPPDLAGALLRRPDILDSLEGWVVFGEDETPRRLADSDLPEADKLRILPAHRPEGLAMLGSKVGLARLQAQAGAGAPCTAAAQTPDDLPRAAADVGWPLLIKSDLGTGGRQVRLVRAGDGPALRDVPADWFPLVVQKHVAGPDVSVEVLVREGDVVGWTYSVALAVAGRHGPTTARRYVRPPRMDFVEHLNRLAAAGGLHGFFNCSLRWSAAERRHYLFEVDPRPNAWHQFGPTMGVDWMSQMTSHPPSGCLSPTLPSAGRTLHLYPREVLWGLDTADWTALRPWLLAEPGTWASRNRRDDAMNGADRADVWTAARRRARFACAQLLGAGWSAVPPGIRGSAAAEAVRQRVGHALGTA